MAHKISLVFFFVLCHALDLDTATGTRVNGKLDDEDRSMLLQDEAPEHPAAVETPAVVLPVGSEADTFRMTLYLVGTIFGIALACSYLQPKVLMPTLYLCANIGIDIAISSQRTHVGGSTSDVYTFDPLCVLVTVETVKFLFSVVMYYRNDARTERKEDTLTKTDVAYFALPAVMFTFANILNFFAMGANDMSVFMLFRDSMVIWTALTWWFVFGAKPNRARIASLAVIITGLILNRVGSFYEGVPWSWSFLWVVVMTLCIAFASVSFELALKRKVNMDIHLQNVVMFGICAGFSLLLLAITDSGRLTGPIAFFQGFTRWTALTCLMGIVSGITSAYLLKFTDAVFKMVAICLRGPLMLCLAAFTPLIPAKVDVTTVIPAAIVVSGCFAYLSHGKMQSPTQEQAEEKKKDLI